MRHLFAFLIALFNLLEVIANIVLDSKALKHFVEVKPQGWERTEWQHSGSIRLIQPSHPFMRNSVPNCVVIRRVFEPHQALHLPSFFNYINWHKNKARYCFSEHTAWEIGYKGVLTEKVHLQCSLFEKFIRTKIKASSRDAAQDVHWIATVKSSNSFRFYCFSQEMH